jgi:hypothetical protein
MRLNLEDLVFEASEILSQKTNRKNSLKVLTNLYSTYKKTHNAKDIECNSVAHPRPYAPHLADENLEIPVSIHTSSLVLGKALHSVSSDFMPLNNTRKSGVREIERNQVERNKP